MRHHEKCREWQNYHPYDCPECKLLNDLGTTYTEDELYAMLEDERNEAYAEGQDDATYDLEDRLTEAEEQGYDNGYKDGQQSVLDAPEDFGLVEA